MKRVTTTLGALLVAMTAIVACGSSSTKTTAAPSTTTATATPLTKLDVTAKDYAFDTHGVTSVPAGLVAVHLTNEGKEDHQVQFARINDGVTPQQLQAASAQGADHALALVTLEGGANAVPVGASQDVVVDFDKPGQYLLLCFVQSPDGKAHADKGMLLPLTVTAPTANPTAPKTAGTVRLADYTFKLPTGFGNGTYEVVNDGPQPHELTIVKLKDGATIKDLGGYFSAPPSGPPPFTAAGGGGGIAPGSTEYVTLALAPGNYVALCFIPDKSDAMPHVAHGMLQPFTVK